MYSPYWRPILFDPPPGVLDQRKSLPNRYPTPKKTRITIATTAATNPIIESSSEPALRSMQESSHSQPQSPLTARAGPIR